MVCLYTMSRVLAAEVSLSACIDCKTNCALLITQKQLTPVFLKIPAQYSFKIVVSNPNNGMVEHLFDAAINLLPYGFLCSLGSQYIVGNCSIRGGIYMFQHCNKCFPYKLVIIIITGNIRGWLVYICSKAAYPTNVLGIRPVQVAAVE